MEKKGALKGVRVQLSMSQLRAYNAMFKLLDDYYKKTKDDDIMSLLPVMVFIIN